MSLSGLADFFKLLFPKNKGDKSTQHNTININIGDGSTVEIEDITGGNKEQGEFDYEKRDLHHDLEDGIECFCKCLFMGFFHFCNKESEQNRKKDDRQHLIVVECLKYILGNDIDQSLPQAFLAFRQSFNLMAEVKVSTHARPDDID